MTTTTAPVKSNAIFLVPLGAAAVLLVIGTLTGRIPFGFSERSAFLILAAIGFTMCAFSPLGQGAVHGWANPRHLAGYVLGTLALALCLGVLFNWPFAAAISGRAALLGLGGIMALKIGIAFTYPRR